MRSQDLHIKISEEMLEKVDLAAADAYQSRSAYVREAIALRLNGQYITSAQAEDKEFDQALQQFLPPSHPLTQNPR